MHGEVRHFLYPEVCNSLLVNLVKKSSKSVNICKRYCKKFTDTFIYGPQCRFSQVLF